MSIKILNLNASFDRWIILKKKPAVETIVRGDEVLSLVNGKGLDVARVLTTLGFDDYECISIIGGITGSIIEKESKKEKLQTRFFSIAEDSRINTILIYEYKRDSLVINETGPFITDEEKIAFTTFLKQHISAPCSLVISGSAPRNFSGEDLYHLLSNLYQYKHCSLKVDASGDILLYAVELPLSVLKINEEEFEAGFGIPVTSTKMLVKFKNTRKIETLIITQGERGAIILSNHHVLKAEFSKKIHGIAVGSGDSFFAGWLYAESQGWDIEKKSTWAMSCGAANLRHYGAAVFSANDVMDMLPFVQVEKIL